MLNLTAEQKKFLIENLDNADTLINSENVNDILFPLDSLITYKGFDDDYVLTAWGNKAQKIYDDIYSQNS